MAADRGHSLADLSQDAPTRDSSAGKSYPLLKPYENRVGKNPIFFKKSIPIFLKKTRIFDYNHNFLTSLENTA